MNARSVLIWAFAVITGCGSSSVPSVPIRFLYVSTYNGGTNFNPGGIYAFGVDAAGRLSPVSGSPFSPTASGSIAISRDSKFLYTVDGRESMAQLWAFTINSDGSLSPVSGSPFTTPEPLGNLVTNPTSDFLYGNSLSGTVMVFAIDPATGAASLTSSVNSGAAGATVTSDGRYYYTTSSEQSLVGFLVNAATGALSPVPGSPLVVAPAGSVELGAIAADSMGKFLYVANDYALQVVKACCVYAFAIDAVSGALTPMPGSPFDVGGGAGPMEAIGGFLITDVSLPPPVVAGGDNCVLSVLSLDPDTGALTVLPGAPRGQCGSIAADPSGAYVYLGVGYESNTGGTIFTYQLDQATGALTAIDSVPVPVETIGSLALTH
jgi:6-phosphogluconolactonase